MNFISYGQKYHSGIIFIMFWIQRGSFTYQEVTCHLFDFLTSQLKGLKNILTSLPNHSPSAVSLVDSYMYKKGTKSDR